MPIMSMSMVPSAAILASQFNAWGSAIGDLNEPLKVAVNDIAAPSIANNFEVGGRPPWVPLQPQTVARRSGSGPVLTDSGELRSVASSPSVWEVRGDSAFIPVTALGVAAYGAFHQSGTRHMPERVWATLQPEDVDRIEELFGDWAGVTAVRTGLITSFLGVFGRLFGRGR